jgi:hypothetical protein
MNANRALGLLAAILVTAGQAMLLAVDTSAAAESTAAPLRYERTLGAKNGAAGQFADGEARGLIGG